MKKLIATIVFTVVLTFCSFTSFAKEISNDMISVEAYEAKMNEIYQKYGCNYEILDTNGTEYVSKRAAEQEYVRVEESLKDMRENEQIQNKMLPIHELLSPIDNDSSKSYAHFLF